MSGRDRGDRGTIRCPRCGAGIDADSRFCDQCGAGQSRPGDGVERLRLVNHTVGLELLAEDGCVVGREEGPLAHVFARYPATSARHCRLDRGEGGRWRVTDLGSSNGTFVDEVRLEAGASAALPPGCFLRVANLELLVTPA